MNISYLKTPVVLIIFRRPDVTEKVFEAIREAQPRTLLVIADGPRSDRPGEDEQCAATRRIIDRVDWNCEVLKNYSDINLGCGVRPATGISWVFEQFEEAIILEDDCLPHPNFFPFCEELLERYRDDQRVMSITGDKSASSPDPYSYYFSKYFSCWGWATWRRAWKYYDFNMEAFPELVEKNWFYNFLSTRQLADFWLENFKSVANPANSNTWDHQWQLASWLQSGLSIRPNANLVCNLGFNADATHTFDSDYAAGYQPIFESMSFPQRHPKYVTPDWQTERVIEEQLLRHRNLTWRIARKMRKLFS